MAFTYLTYDYSTGGVTASTALSSLSILYQANVPIIVTAGINTAILPSVTDTGGLTWIELWGNADNGGGSYVWYAMPTSAGATTITVNTPSAAFFSMRVITHSGMAGEPVLAGAGSTGFTGSPTVFGTTYVPTSTASALWLAANDFQAVATPFTANTGCTAEGIVQLGSHATNGHLRPTTQPLTSSSSFDLLATAATSTNIAWIAFEVPDVSTITIGTQPENQTATAGNVVGASVTAISSAGTLTYQWQSDATGSFANIPGETGDSYITTLTANQRFSVRCVLDDGTSNIITNAATLCAVPPRYVGLRRGLGRARRGQRVGFSARLVNRTSGLLVQSLTDALSLDYSAPTVQTLAAPLLTNSQSFLAPTVSLGGSGAQTLSPGLLTNTATFFAPTVTRGSVTLAPGILTNTSSFFTPTVTSGAVTLVPSLLTNTSAVFGPTVSPGTFPLAPALLSNSNTLFAPTVTPGAVTLTPGLLTNTSTLLTPTVSTGGGATQTLSPSLLTNVNSFFAPTVAPGSVSLAPSLASNAQTFYSPTIATSAVTLELPLLSNAQGFLAPTVSVGSVDVNVPLLSNTQQFFSASVSNGPAVLATPLLVNDQVFFAATVVPGAITLTPIRLDNVAAVYLPGVATSNEVAIPLVANTSTVFEPAVSVGAVGVQPALLLNAQQFFAPVVDNGTYTLTLAQAQALYQVYLLHGLKVGAPLTVSQTQRMAGGLEQAINESGGTVTITTVSAPFGAGVDVGSMVNELAQWYGLTTPMSITATSQVGGLISQTLTAAAGITTVVRQ